MEEWALDQEEDDHYTQHHHHHRHHGHGADDRSRWGLQENDVTERQRMEDRLSRLMGTMTPWEIRQAADRRREEAEESFSGRVVATKRQKKSQLALEEARQDMRYAALAREAAGYADAGGPTPAQQANDDTRYDHADSVHNYLHHRFHDPFGNHVYPPHGYEHYGTHGPVYVDMLDDTPDVEFNGFGSSFV